MRKTIHFICFTLLTLGMFSCQQSEILYYHFNELKDARWSKNDTLMFEIDSTLFEPNVPYNVNIELTSNVNYPYQNIWFLVQSNFENDSVYNTLSKEYLLADEFGKWKGAGFGSLYQISLSLYKDIRFDEKRNYKIRIGHAMRDEPLEGIEKVGIRVSRQE